MGWAPVSQMLTIGVYQTSKHESTDKLMRDAADLCLLMWKPFEFSIGSLLVVRPQRSVPSKNTPIVRAPARRKGEADKPRNEAHSSSEIPHLVQAAKPPSWTGGVDLDKLLDMSNQDN